MRLTKLIVSLFLLTFLFSIVFSVETHCWRQDINRGMGLSVNVEFTEKYSTEPIVVPLTSTLKLGGFGSYRYTCENGASGHHLNYFEVYDLKTGKIIATNGMNQNTGPASSGSRMCYNTLTQNACYLVGKNYYPAKNSCDNAGWYVGAGRLDPISINLNEYLGEQSWVVRVGLISPYFDGIQPGSEKIKFESVKQLDFIVSPPPSILVFPPTPLQKMNSFDLDGNVVKETHFTLLNKSRHPIVIKNYWMDCPNGLNCVLDEGEEGGFYDGFTIEPNKAMSIPVIFSINKNDLPKSLEAIMNVEFLPKGASECLVGKCLAKSTPVKFEAGFLGQQEFQINAINQQEQKYCVNAEGKLGVTGEGVLPRINLYFGGNSPVNNFIEGSNDSSKLISLNECSPFDYNSGLPNPDWVYCTQKEFLIQLADRIDLYYTMLDQIKSMEQLEGRFGDATKLRQKSGLVSSFTAYLRNQNLSRDNRIISINELDQINRETILSKIGLNGEQINNNFSKFENLIKGIRINQYDRGVRIDSLDFSPGEYIVNIDINLDNYDGLGLFVGGGLNETVSINMGIEKKSSPNLDWFFYYEDNNYSTLTHAPSTTNIAVTNYENRGKIMTFKKEGGSTKTNLDKFYSTYAVPLIIRLGGSTEESNKPMFRVSVVNWNYGEEGVFSVWSGFASSLGNGCESTVRNLSGSKQVLPYRIFDSLKNTIGTISHFNFPDLNELQPSTVMYLSTVIYLPEGEQIQLKTNSFNIFSGKEEIIASSTSEGEFRIMPGDYSANTINSLNQLFEGIRDEKVCVSFDNSSGVDDWELFWNQDKILDQLEGVKKNIRDAKLCETSELKSS